ncbi:MAG TPA: VCBS repeat-containing protein, partial [Solirubrobacterales bacterium]|nr:VCBS repeat-containing protein [Solirubrobacterales bacterium]
GSIDSSLLDGRGEELVGLFDYDRDRRADLVSVNDDGRVLTYRALSGATFDTPVNQGGDIESRRLDRRGHEMASEKPFLRRTDFCKVADCIWRSPVDSDVDGDGRSDLVTVDSDGTAHVFRGTANGIEAAASADSLTEQVDPALYDGGGHYLIDTADVSGDGRADLVTMGSAGGVYVHKGKADRTFAPVGAAQLTSLKPVMNGTGVTQPIAIADGDGDGDNDLIAAEEAFPGFFIWGLAIYPNDGRGTFGSVVYGNYTTTEALLDGSGAYHLDVTDVTGDGYPDLVEMDTNGTTSVYKGPLKDNRSPSIARTSINPIFDDGRGEEPVGLGDVNADAKADLLTLDGTTLKLRTGKSDGTFNSPTTAYTGSIDSSLLDGRGEELVGLFDYDRDRRADLVSVNDDGRVLTYAAQSGGTFASPVNQGGSINSIRLGSTGHEMASEKPFIRRAGCLSTGCKWPPGS